MNKNELAEKIKTVEAENRGLNKTIKYLELRLKIMNDGFILNNLG